MTPARSRFRAILTGDACVHPGSVFDPPSALLAEQLGYEAAILGGSIASLTVLGSPDLILLTLSEFAEQARRICRVTEMPLLVDADHGYGNALNVMRTVRELEDAGVAALTLEDTLLPRPAHGTKPALIPIEEGVGKVRAALAARRDPGLVIAGRTSAMEIAGLDEALTRVTAYAEAGADAVFLTGVKTRAQIEAVCARVKVPVLVGAVGPEIADAAYLGGLGVRCNVLGHQPYMAALQATYETMRALRAGTRPADLPGLLPRDRLALVERRDLHDQAIRQFLDGEAE
jgi:carboxyvinyl-carboxyphosphonate phosphorylmutase